MKTPLIITLLIILSASALAYNSQTTINITELPAEGFEPMALGLEKNYSIYLTQYLEDDRINLTFPAEYYYNNTTVSNFTIHYNIDNFLLLNNLTIELAINITSDHPNFNHFTYGLFFNLIKGDELLVGENGTDIFYLIESGWGFNISTNLLPISKEKSFSLQGEPGTQVNITHCDEWLTCPDNFTFDESGVKSIKIIADIPSNATIGEYERRFVLKSKNITRFGKVLINIIDPELVFEEYVFRDWCFQSDENLLACIEEERDFNTQRLSDIYALALSKLKNMTKIVYNQTEVLVMTGSIDKELKSLYDSCIQDKSVTVNEKRNCGIDLNDLESVIKDLEAKIKTLEENNTITQQQQEAEKKQRSKKVRDWITGITVIILIIGSITGWIVWYKKVNFR